MKRLHVIFGRPPIRGGGAALVAKHLLEWQTAQGEFTVCLSTGWFDGGPPELRRVPSVWECGDAYEMWNVGDHPASGSPNLEAKGEGHRLLSDLLDIHSDIELVHISNLLTLPISAIGLFKSAGMRVIVELHDYFPVCTTLYLFRSDSSAACRDFEGGRACQRCVGDATSNGALMAMERVRATLKYPPAYMAARWLWRKTSGIRPASRAPASAFVDRRHRFADALAKADAVIAVSTRQRESLASHGLAGIPMSVLPSRVKDLPFPEVIRDYSHPLRFVFIGSLSRQKGAVNIVRAFREVDPHAAIVDLYGWADGGLHLELRSLAGEHEGIRFHGRYSRRDLPRILQSAHVGLVLPEWEEAFGLTGIELLSSGLPLIATGLGGAFDYAEHGRNALVVPPGDPGALRAAVNRLVEDQALLNRLAANSGRPKYTFEQRCLDIESLYSRLSHDSKMS